MTKQSTSSTLVTRVINDQGRAFNVVLVRRGDRYGLDNCLINEGDDVLIEFYDATYENDERFEKGRGQFVARYYLSTLTNSRKSGNLRGIDLCAFATLMSHDPAWKVSGQNVVDALAAVEAALAARDDAPTARAKDIWERRERAMFGCTAAEIDEALAGKDPRDIAMYATDTLSNAQELIAAADDGWIVASRDAATLRQLINVAKYALDKAVPR